ncbi:MAG: Coenzyme F420 hydrogenase/dehydrogenase, beta subunit C-terminal domain [Lachnospiraceae bacterium]|nr:Coenzyme F420 hydrogenase/dehydrogenase, beta subunit C-terminal domain [Lachnospiraceae bacterium]
MIKYDFNEYCSGCGVCANVCPTKAIRMVQGKYGFPIPQIDEEKCVHCGMCDKVCPHINAEKRITGQKEVKGTWLYASEDKEAKMRSSSGSAFYELAKYYISQQYYVCGCVWDENLKAEHIIGNGLDSIKRMQGSKYVQSDVGDCYNKTISLIKEGNKVLFSGTPCQAVAMHNLAMQIDGGKYRDNLLTVAVICHGIATPSAWESYKKYLSELNDSRLIHVNFRDKSRDGYKKSYCKYEYESGKVIYQPTFLPSSKYIEATLVYNLAMRSSCSHCDCKGINEGCDLVIGDWYTECMGEGELGTSCIVAFTERGYSVANEILNGLREIKYDKILQENGFIEKSVNLGKKRDEFLLKMNNEFFWESVEALYPAKYKYKKILIKCGIYNFIKKFMK